MIDHLTLSSSNYGKSKLFYEDLQYLLVELRTVESLKERSLGCFYFKSKGVLHFHVKGERRFAHIYDGKGWKELDIKLDPSINCQKQILKQIRDILPLKP